MPADSRQQMGFNSEFKGLNFVLRSKQIPPRLEKLNI
jgi:hypothetical protein